MDTSRNQLEATVLEGRLDAAGHRFAVIVSRFNSFVTERLLEGCVDTLRRSGATSEAISVLRTPGAYEIPQVVEKVLEVGGYDAVITLGCLIKGDTIHFDLIASESAKGCSAAGCKSGVPVIFGVLTTDTLEQAIDRAGAKAGNKGSEAALAAIEQVNLYSEIIRHGAEARGAERS